MSLSVWVWIIIFCTLISIIPIIWIGCSLSSWVCLRRLIIWMWVRVIMGSRPGRCLWALRRCCSEMLPMWYWWREILIRWWRGLWLRLSWVLRWGMWRRDCEVMIEGCLRRLTGWCVIMSLISCLRPLGCRLGFCKVKGFPNRRSLWWATPSWMR